MVSIFELIKSNILQAVGKLGLAPEQLPVDPMVRQTTENKFGDYQCNIAMGLAKKLNRNPRELAQDIIKQLSLDAVCEKIEIAGPGFINLFLRPDYLAACLHAIKQDERLGVAAVQNPSHHIIDFSSPNLAKEMHVGHLRTTITGEVIARIIAFMGHTIDRVNHVGDWGTQFGMLLQYIYDNHPEVIKNPEQFQVKDLEVFYKQAKKCFDTDAQFAENARSKVVLLQSHDATAMQVWKAFVKESLRHCHEIYGLLDVSLLDVGESFYNDRLPEVVTELQKAGLAREDQGAVCVFLDGFTNRQGEPLPMIIRKSDGGYNYDTTDLAAIKYRIKDCKADRLIYVTDIRQAQHFNMLFAAARKVGWAKDKTDLCHIGYGMVLGQDRKPFKTRDGGTVRLKELIEESVERARLMLVEKRSSDFSQEQIAQVSRAVGLAAIKYSDMSHNLASDYVFSWDKMLAMDGNTGPYMMYAYARIKSIGRKGGVDLDALPVEKLLCLSHPAEYQLAKTILGFSDIVHEVARDLKPNVLTDYLYGLSKAFSTFYDKKSGVSVLEAETEEAKWSRLWLCALTARTLKTGLKLLSIDVVEEM